MKKIFISLVFTGFLCIQSNAQNSNQSQTYKVPDAYHFDYKVVYEMNREDNKAPETMTYYFTKNGDYISMETPDKESKDMKSMIWTKDGLMITFGEEPVPNNSGKNRKVLKVMDMRSMMKGSGDAIAAMAKNMPKNDKEEAEKKKPNPMDNFVKTGRTKQFFGYTADEYSKEFTAEENGKMHSGTGSVWYASVDFDPSMMFSFGMGSIAGGRSRSGMQGEQSKNMFGIGLTKKNYMLMDMEFTEKGGKTGVAMKVVNIEKTNINKSTEGYIIKNYAGLSMKEMMQKEMEEK